MNKKHCIGLKEETHSVDDVGKEIAAFNHMAIRLRSMVDFQDNQYTVVYVWIDGTGIGLRSKTRVLKNCLGIADVPEWDFDGSSTCQSITTESDIILKPIRLYRDPFFCGEKSFLVLCETYNQDGTPTVKNNRLQCIKTMKKCAVDEPWFGIEQEYTLVEGEKILQKSESTFDDPILHGQHYCGTGSHAVIGRYVCDLHLKACIYAGVGIAGTNAELTYGQWEFQLAPSGGVKQSDDLWMARYILLRVAEEFGMKISFHPKPTGAGTRCNGSGAHTNFSTVSMRKPISGIQSIKAAISLLEKKHSEHLLVYDPNGGKDNLQRLVGLYETAAADVFVAGMSDRSASIRIPHHVHKAKCGYLEDRRPASNCDPYLVCERIARTVCLVEN